MSKSQMPWYWSLKCTSRFSSVQSSLALSLQIEQTLWLRWLPWILGSPTSCLRLFYCKKFPFYLKGGEIKNHEQKRAFLLSDCLWGPNIWHREVFTPLGVTRNQCLWWNDWIIKAALLTLPCVFVQRSNFMNEVIGLMRVCWTIPRAEHLVSALGREGCLGWLATALLPV